MKKEPTFAQAITRLEEIVDSLENKDLDLEEAVDLLTEGIELHKKCNEKLTHAQNKIDTLFTQGENGRS